MRTHYTTLGIDENVSDEKIHQAYQHLFIENYDDEDRLKEIFTAFNALGKLENRLVYDIQLALERKSEFMFPQVDNIILKILSNSCDPVININIYQYFDLIKYSIILDGYRKKHLIDVTSKLSQDEINDIIQSLINERELIGKRLVYYYKDNKKLIEKWHHDWWWITS